MCVDEFWEIERVTPSENKRKLIEWRRMNQQKGTSLPHTTHVRLSNIQNFLFLDGFRYHLLGGP